MTPDDASDAERFGRYELRRLVGRGGMGEVWCAYDHHNHREVALKRITSAAASDENFRTRFTREARVTASLTSPHVITVHDVGEIDGRLYLDMRLVDGEDLHHAIAASAGGLDLTRVVTIIGQVADALDCAHRRDLVHRDVKPSNILLGSARGQDFAYLVDFGIAKAAEQTGLTGTGATIGTLAYMAPELFDGGEATPRSDVYALACVLHEAVTGRRAFPAESTPAVLNAHLNGAPPTLGRADLADLDRVLRSALAKSPAERHGSAGEFADAVACAVPTSANRVHSASTRPASARAAAAVTQLPDRDAAAPPTPVPGWWSRRRGAAAAVSGVVAVLALIATLALIGTRGDTSPPSASPAPTPTVTPTPTADAPMSPLGPAALMPPPSDAVVSRAPDGTLAPVGFDLAGPPVRNMTPRGTRVDLPRDHSLDLDSTDADWGVAPIDPPDRGNGELTPGRYDVVSRTSGGLYGPLPRTRPASGVALLEGSRIYSSPSYLGHASCAAAPASYYYDTSSPSGSEDMCVRTDEERLAAVRVVDWTETTISLEIVVWS